MILAGRGEGVLDLIGHIKERIIGIKSSKMKCVYIANSY